MLFAVRKCLLGVALILSYISRSKPPKPQILECQISSQINTLKLMAKTSQFRPSCKDSKKLQERWTYKTAKIFSRTRRVRPWSVDALSNASSGLRDTFFYVSNSISDYRFQNFIRYGSRLSFLNMFTMTIEWSCCWQLLCFVNKSSNCRPNFSMAYNELLLVDNRSVLLSYHLLLNHPDTDQVTPKKQNHSLLRLLES
jgi:hypothetical protein